MPPPPMPPPKSQTLPKGVRTEELLPLGGARRHRWPHFKKLVKMVKRILDPVLLLCSFRIAGGPPETSSAPTHLQAFFLRSSPGLREIWGRWGTGKMAHTCGYLAAPGRQTWSPTEGTKPCKSVPLQTLISTCTVWKLFSHKAVSWLDWTASQSLKSHPVPKTTQDSSGFTGSRKVFYTYIQARVA